MNKWIVAVAMMLIAFAGFASGMASRERDAELRKDMDTLQATVAKLEANTASNMAVMANVDTMIIRNVKQMQEVDARFNLQHRLTTRALIEEMGQKEYQKEVDKFLADLEAAKKAQAESAAQPKK